MRSAAADTAIEQGLSPAWLCTITLPDGRAIRVASTAISVETGSATDGPYQFAPFLAGVDEFEEELDPFALEGQAALTQARVEITTTDDLAALHGSWHHVTAASVELALCWPEQAWEDRVVMLASGRVQGVKWGRLGEATTFTIETSPETGGANVGDDTRDVEADFPGALGTDAVALTALDGVHYQRVYGSPGSVPGYKVGNVGALGFNRVVCAGDHWPSLGSITVYQDGVSAGAYTPATATATSGPYTYVQDAALFDSGNGAVTFSADRGGVRDAFDLANAAIGAGDVVRTLLSESGIKVDWRRTQRALDLLAGWRVGFWIDEEASAIELLRDRLLPWLPLVELISGDGTWFHYADPEAAPIEADLVLGQQLLGRTERMESSDLDVIRNAFTLRHTREEFSGEYLSTATLDASNSALCYLSDQLYGTRADDVQECDVCWDATTALRILAVRAARVAMPRRILKYAMAPQLYWLRAGAGVTLTDADYGIDRARGVVTSIRRVGAPEITIELVDRTPFSVVA